MDNHGPVLYAGSTPNKNGHAFVCDGYSSGYFHINWGWGGMSDGYYTLSALDPTYQGVGGGTSGYNIGQEIITNIYPNQGDKSWIELVSDFPFVIKENSANLGKAINFTVGLLNFSAVKIKPTVGLAFTNTSTKETTFSTGYQVNGELSPLTYFLEPLQIRQNIPANLSNGTYQVRPAYQDLSGDWHILHVAMTQIRAYNMTVSGNSAKFSVDEAPIPTVSASGLLTPLYSYSAFKASMTLRNPSNSEFYGIVYPCFIRDGVIVHKATALSVTLDGLEKRQIEYIGTCSLDAGQYQMCYCIQSPDDPNSYRLISNQFNVTVSQAQQVVPQLSELRFAEDNTTDINASSLTLSFDDPERRNLSKSDISWTVPQWRRKLNKHLRFGAHVPQPGI